ncbi:MAG: sodium-dependent transporter [Erysipelotrichaceae bacterium]|nr:sodium-dependent transporter [Erysipelotrichaceae bacterium]
MEREKLASRLGFILLSAGCAIGIGNVWKFPYVVGQYGGGAFVLFYLLFLLIFGVPILTMEFSMGRAAQKSPVKLYQVLQKPNHKWHIHGYVCMFANYLLMMFYTVVTGWMLYYLYASITGLYIGLDSNQTVSFFTNMLLDYKAMLICTITVIISGFLIISVGLVKGLEKVTKVMMVLLIVLMLTLAINSIFLKGGMEGLIFYLKPDFNKVKEIGILNVIIRAMTQSFFTLSLGIGAMAIFGSYIDKKHSLLNESVNVAVLDTFVALCSGLIIFPACFAYNINVDSGPSLLFITLPNVFNNLVAGRLWGSLFFLFMLFAAYSTVLAVFENIISCCMDLFKISRKKACYINMILLIVLSLPCALGFNLLSNIQPLGVGSTILDLEDYLVSNILLPLGSLIFLIFCTSKYGWGYDNFTQEANTGKGMKLQKWMKFYLKYVLPILLIVVFILGLI